MLNLYFGILLGSHFLLVLHDLHFNFLDFLIEYLQIRDIVPDSKVKDSSECDKNGRRKVERVSEGREEEKLVEYVIGCSQGFTHLMDLGS